MLLIVSLIYICLPFYINASPFELLSRDSSFQDPYMVCEDPPPLSALPSNYPRDSYRSTIDLCSALNGATLNVGCVWYVVPLPVSYPSLPVPNLPFPNAATNPPDPSTATNPSPTRPSSTPASPLAPPPTVPTKSCTDGAKTPAGAQTLIPPVVRENVPAKALLRLLLSQPPPSLQIAHCVLSTCPTTPADRTPLPARDSGRLTRLEMPQRGHGGRISAGITVRAMQIVPREEEIVRV